MSKLAEMLEEAREEIASITSAMNTSTRKIKNTLELLREALYEIERELNERAKRC